VTICHKLDVIPSPLTGHAHKPEKNLYLLTLNTCVDQNSRYSMSMDYTRKLIEQSGNNNDDLLSTGIISRQAPGNTLQFVGNWLVLLDGETTRALMAALSLTKSTV